MVGLAFHKCRLCLKLGDFCSIFDRDDAIKLSEMVMSFTSIQILEGDGLPDRVCTTCLENLSTAYLFKLQCERIDAVLRNSTDKQVEVVSANNYNDLFNQDFFMHAKYDPSECDNDENSIKDSSGEEYRNEISDETDSDVDSVKCVFCGDSYSHLGTHSCHITCTIEHNELQRSSSNETLVATDVPSIAPPLPPIADRPVQVSCVLCDDVYDSYHNYVAHLNKCTTNVKLHHFVCPVCHNMYSDKVEYLEHLRIDHFKIDLLDVDQGVDCVDFAPRLEKTRKPKAVRRQIGWSVEDIYQEIECKKVDEKPVSTPSPIKKFFSKLGNE